MAIKMKNEGRAVTLIDLDIINPFYRVSDYIDMLNNHNIKTILPNCANTTSDMPGLSPRINEIFTQNDNYYILDVGGDDVGATILGQYSDRLNENPYDMFLVVNKYRYNTRTIEQVIEIYKQIECASKLKFTGLINNSNLGKNINLKDLAIDFINELSAKLNLLEIRGNI